jgi:uncharacterized protein YeaO (DUF488 family)
MSDSGWTIDVRRVYDPPGPDDGYRALVDRIWPRSLTKTAAAIDEWCRDIAPSTELRRWYGHDPTRFHAFRGRYLTELDDPIHAEPLAHLHALTDTRLTLLTATRDLGISHARILAERLSWGHARDHPAVTHVHLDH